MCGIYITNKKISELQVTEKLKSIDYRGPDNLTVKSYDDSVVMGHLRLSILDLDERSNQPYCFDKHVVTFNGEIYNFLDVKKDLKQLGYKFETESDTEVLVKSYHAWGKEMLNRINGMFAFCIYDIKNKKIFGARDRLGVKPFYYFWNKEKFEVASQLRPLIDNSSKINEEAISIYLSTGYVPSPYSIIDNVYKLKPGNFIDIDLQRNSLEVKEYWNLKSSLKIESISYNDAKASVLELLKDAVKIRLQSDVPIGSFLSGGIDSALVSAIAAEISNKPIKTFSIGFDDPKHDESKVAEQYANIIKSEHTTIMCSIEDVMQQIPRLKYVYDEPFGDSSALPSLLLNKVTKEYVTVALSGDGGDESFFGYNYFDLLNKNRKYIKIPLFIRKIISKFYIIPEYLKTEKTIYGIAKYYFTELNNLQLHKKQFWLKSYKYVENLSNHAFQRAADLNIKLWLENDSNVKVDRASMAYSVEVRSPFLDYRLVELARKLPIKYRYNKGLKKKILRDILELYIPKEVFNQPKKGFGVPIGDWMRTDLRQEFDEALNLNFLNQIPNLDVKKFQKQYKSHMQNNTDYTPEIWKMFVLRKWYDEFGFYKK